MSAYRDRSGRRTAREAGGYPERGSYEPRRRRRVDAGSSTDYGSDQFAQPVQPARSDRAARSARSAQPDWSERSDASASRYSRSSGAYASDPVEYDIPDGAYASTQTAQYSRENAAVYSHKNARRQGRGRRIAITVVLAFVVVLVGAGAAAALFLNSVNNNLKGDKTEEEQLQIQEKLVATTSFNDPFWMLLIGSDAREDDEDMGQRADTTILVRVDPVKQYVGMLSIPRDTMITYKGSTVKFNAAYAYDGAAGAIQAASDLCGVKISHYAEVDFSSLESLVDAIGGVDIEVETRIDNWKAGDEVIEAGLQHLNGAQALVYARDRDYLDGDFTRTMHQRTLVKAMVDRVLTLDVGSIPGVIQAVSKCVSTDLTANEVYSLAMQFKDMENFQMYSIMVPSTTATIGGVSYVIADSNGLAKVLQALEDGIDPNTVVTDADGATSGTNVTWETPDD